MKMLLDFCPTPS